MKVPKATKEIIGTIVLVVILVSVLFWYFSIEGETENIRILVENSNSELPPTWEELINTIDRSGVLVYNSNQMSLGFRSLFIEAPNELFDDFGRHNWSAGEISLLDYEAGKPKLDRERAQFRGRGNTTWSMSSVTAKRPLRFRLQSAADVLGRGEARNYILLAAGNETSHFRNWVALSLAAELDGLDFVPSVELVNVYFNNRFIGVYLLTDERDLAPGRSSIRPHELPNLSEFLLEKDARASGDTYFDYVITSGGRFNMRHPSGVGNVRAAHGHMVRDLLDEFLVALRLAAETNDFYLLASYVDIDSFIDFYLLYYALGVDDFGGLSVWFEIRFSDGGQLGSTFSAGPGRRIYMGPVWDFDVMANIHPENFGLGDEVRSQWLSSALEIDEFNLRFNQRAEHLLSILPGVQAQAERVLEYNYFNLNRSYAMNFQERQAENSREVTELRDDFDRLFTWLDLRFNWMTQNPATPRRKPEFVDLNFRGETVRMETLIGHPDLIPVTDLSRAPFMGQVEWLEDRLIILDFESFALRFETGSYYVQIQTGRFESKEIRLENRVEVMLGRNSLRLTDMQKVLDLISDSVR